MKGDNLPPPENCVERAALASWWWSLSLFPFSPSALWPGIPIQAGWNYDDRQWYISKVQLSLLLINPQYQLLDLITPRNVIYSLWKESEWVTGWKDYFHFFLTLFLPSFSLSLPLIVSHTNPVSEFWSERDGIELNLVPTDVTSLKWSPFVKVIWIKTLGTGATLLNTCDYFLWLLQLLFIKVERERDCSSGQIPYLFHLPYEFIPREHFFSCLDLTF